MSKNTGSAQTPSPQRDPHEAISLIRNVVAQLLNDPGTPRPKQRLLEKAAVSTSAVEAQLDALIAAAQEGAELPKVAMRVMDHVRLPERQYRAFIRAVRRALVGQQIDVYAAEHERDPDLDAEPYRIQREMPRFTRPGRQSKLLNSGKPWGTRIVNHASRSKTGLDPYEVTLRLSRGPLAKRGAPPVPALTGLERALANRADAETILGLLEAVAHERESLEERLAAYPEEEKLSGEFRRVMSKAAEDWGAAQASGPALKRLRVRREAAERKDALLLAAERREAEVNLRIYQALENEAREFLLSGDQVELPAKKEQGDISPSAYGVLTMRFRRPGGQAEGAEHPGMKYDVPLSEADVLALLSLVWDYGKGHLPPG